VQAREAEILRALLSEGLSPRRPPGSPPRRALLRAGQRSSLTSGLKLLLWAEPREARAVPSVSRGSRRLREVRGEGDMVQVFGAAGPSGLRSGPTPWGSRCSLGAFVFRRH
jgi:hypothetical protein